MDARQFWSALGMDRPTEHVYLEVLSQPALTVEAYAARAGCSPAAADVALRTLVTLRLVREGQEGYQPVEPRTALTSIARAHQAALDQAGLVADELVETYAATRLNAAPSLLFDVLTAEEIGGRLADMIAAANHSVDATAAPPYSPSTNPVVEAAEQAALQRGIRFRAVYDAAILRNPTQVDDVLQALKAGEQARTSPGLRTKMIVVDGLQVLLPLIDVPRDGAIQAVVLSQSSLVNALQDLFNLLWKEATPLGLDQRPRSDGLRLSDSRLLQLLAAGLSDQAIERQLAISNRTLRRRIMGLQTRLGTVTRFQLGVAAQRRGLLD